MLFVLCRRFLDPSDVFSTHYTPLQSLRVATSSAKGCYVLRSATPKGPRPSLRTPQPFAPDSTTLAPFVPFRSLRKVVRDPKKSLRTRVFSVLSSEKKKKDCKNAYYSPNFSPFLSVLSKKNCRENSQNSCSQG